MMKLKYISDAHIDFEEFNFISDKKAVLVIAGDLTNGITGKKPLILDFLKDACEKHKYVLMVLGNHDYYDYASSMDEIRQFYESLEFDNFMLLTAGVHTVIDGVMFVGDTLWTDLSSTAHARNAERCMNDYRMIQYHVGHKLRAKNTTDMHRHQTEALKASLAHGKRIGYTTVLVTHHPAHKAFLCPNRYEDDVSFAYVTHNEELLKKVDIHIAGHTHKVLLEMDEETNTLLLSNAAGYYNDVHGFDKDAFIYIDRG